MSEKIHSGGKVGYRSRYW